MGKMNLTSISTWEIHQWYLRAYPKLYNRPKWPQYQGLRYLGTQSYPTNTYLKPSDKRNLHEVTRLRFVVRNRGTSVSVATDYGVRFPVGRKDFSVFHSVQTGSAAQPASNPTSAGIFPGIKLPECEADHSPPSGAEIMNGGAIPHLPNTSLRHCTLLIKHRHDCTFTGSCNISVITMSICLMIYTNDRLRSGLCMRTCIRWN
jgi:hypothetical protein